VTSSSPDTAPWAPFITDNCKCRAAAVNKRNVCPQSTGQFRPLHMPLTSESAANRRRRQRRQRLHRYLNGSTGGTDTCTASQRHSSTCIQQAARQHCKSF